MTGNGVWDAAHQCYAVQANLPLSHPAWQGNTDGSVWQCGEVLPPVYWWVPPNQPLVDPAALARQASGELPLATAQVRTAPQPPDYSIVTVENWLWIPREQWVPLRKTVTAGSTSVTATARPSQVVWDMGEGSVTCYDEGRPWRLGMTDAAQTRCKFAYATTSIGEPDERFSISATIQYAVTWTCSGTCPVSGGDLGLIAAPAGTGSLEVRQRQTVVINP